LARLPIPDGADDVTPEWLTAVLNETGALRGGRVAELEWERVGMEYGFTGVVIRLLLRYERATKEAPRSLIAKLPMAKTAQMSGYRAVQERHPEQMQRYYERAVREVRFYREVGAAFAPRMYYADSDDTNRRVVLLLEDVSCGRQGDVLHGCSVDDAEQVIEELAPFHARWWGDRAPRHAFSAFRQPPRVRQERYDHQVEPFLAQYGASLPAGVRPIISGLRSRLATVADALYSGPQSLIHADLHLDNMIFDPPAAERSVIVLDWQTASVSSPALDVAFFLSDSLTVENRRAAEQMLLELYVTLLAAHGVRNYTVEELRTDYGRALLLRLAGTVGWLTTVAGDDLTSHERALQEAALGNGRLAAALLDHDALALLG
jgi:aminoglycoside/choline kinase family phosphotransferase